MSDVRVGVTFTHVAGGTYTWWYHAGTLFKVLLMRKALPEDMEVLHQVQFPQSTWLVPFADREELASLLASLLSQYFEGGMEVES